MARQFTRASSEYLEIDSAVVTAAPFTVACWFFLDSVSVNSTFISIPDKDVNTHYFVLNFENAGLVRWRVRADGFATADTTAGPSISTWHHTVAVEAASNDHSVYLDGGNVGTNTVSRAPTGVDRTSIGRHGAATPGQYMGGRLAECGIWNAALNADEISSLAAGYSPLFVRPQSLVAYWPLIRDEDQDRVGGFDLTAFNTPTISDHPPIIYPASPLLSHFTPTVAGAIMNQLQKNNLGADLFNGTII